MLEFAKCCINYLGDPAGADGGLSAVSQVRALDSRERKPPNGLELGLKWALHCAQGWLWPGPSPGLFVSEIFLKPTFPIR